MLSLCLEAARCLERRQRVTVSAHSFVDQRLDFETLTKTRPVMKILALNSSNSA